MSASKNRSRSLDYTLKNSKRNWLRFIFSGFGTSQKYRRRQKSEKSAYSQTEIYHIICHNETGTQCSNNYSKSSQNVSSENSKSLISTSDVKEFENSNKVYHKYNHITRRANNDWYSHPGINASMVEFSEDLITEYCSNVIKHETVDIKSSIMMQQMKFKHELSKLYKRIYTGGNSTKNNNIYCPKIINDDIGASDIKAKSLYPELKVTSKCDESENKKHCAIKTNFSKRYIIKKQPVCKDEKLRSIKEKVHDVDNTSDKRLILDLQNDNVDLDDVKTMTCAVSLSSSSIHSNEYSTSIHSQLQQRSKNDNTPCSKNIIKKDVSYMNVVSIDTKEEPSRDNANQSDEKLFVRYNEKEFQRKKRPISSTNENTRINSLKNNANTIYQCREKVHNSRQNQESSIILDFEVLPCSVDKYVASSNSDHTFSDVRTLSTHDDYSQNKYDLFRSPVLISVAWSNGKNQMSNTGDDTNFSPQYMDHSKISLPCLKNEISALNCDYLERNCETEKSVSTKYSHLQDHCVTLSESVSHRYGTLCEVLSDDGSNNSDMSYRPGNSALSRKGSSGRTKLNATFRKHTISSKLKMKIDS